MSLRNNFVKLKKYYPTLVFSLAILNQKYKIKTISNVIRNSASKICIYNKKMNHTKPKKICETPSV